LRLNRPERAGQKRCPIVDVALTSGGLHLKRQGIDMNKFVSVMAAAVTSVSMVGAAGATPISGIVEEGGPEGYYSGLVADHTFGDFSNSTNTPLLEAVDDFTIYGSVWHRSATDYQDGWTMDFGSGEYELDFSWQNVTDKDLDFVIRIISAGGTSSYTGLSSLSFFGYETAYDSGTWDASGYTFSGLWTIQIDPVYGQLPRGETMRWQLAATNVAPIPLPASALLLLGGLGGLALTRRRRNAA
jgi:hypothetical protein